MKFNYSDLPDASRIPRRPPEDAVYRTNAPSEFHDNPLYLALPGLRTMEEVIDVIEAGNPTLDQSVLTLSVLERKERVNRVRPVLFAVRQHAAMESLVMSTNRNAFSSRHWTARFMEKSIGAAWGANNGSRFEDDPVGAGAVFGGPGEGKTVSLKTILMSCPQVVHHHTFKGQRIGVIQVVWMYLSMPPKASPSGLLAWIMFVLDLVLGTNYLNELERDKGNHSLKTRLVASKLATHAVGVIYCDEFQNIQAGAATQRKELDNTLQELINLTQTRFVFVGTHESRSVLKSPALERRMIGEEGQLIWRPLPLGAEWNDFLERLWEWQVTKIPTPLTQELKVALHRLTGGVPDYAKKLFQAAQSRIIGNSKHPEEQLSLEVFQSTLEESFTDLHEKLETQFKIQRKVSEANARAAASAEKAAAGRAA